MTTNNKLNPHDAESKNRTRPHLWEVSALTTVASLLPQGAVCSNVWGKLPSSCRQAKSTNMKKNSVPVVSISIAKTVS